MRRFLTTLMILLVVLVAGLSALVLLVNPNDFRDYMVKQVAARSGYQLQLDGPLRWHVWPQLSILSGRMSLTAQGASQPLVRADNMRLDVALLPLLSHQLSVKQVMLKGAVIQLTPQTEAVRSEDAPVAPRDNTLPDLSDDRGWSFDISSLKVADSVLVFQYEPVAAGLDYEAILQEEKRVLVVDIGGGTTDCSLLLMGPQWRSRLDREASLLGHSGCRIGGNDLDIALAFKNLMPLLGMGGETEKGIALPILPWWNAVAINDVPAQSDFYSSANGRLLNDLVRDAREPEKVALLQKVWRQRLSYRLVRSAEESKIALSSVAETRASLPFISDELATLISQQGLESALNQPLARILEQVQLALDNAQEKPDVIYLTGGSARSPLIKKALTEQLPGIPIAGGDDFGSVTAGLARWAEVVFR